MIVARSTSEVAHEKKSVVTVGTFDGLHLGHQKILSRLRYHAEKRWTRSVVVTFDPHPREVVGRGPVKLLTTLDERIELFESTGIDVLIVVPFTYEFSRQSSRAFYEREIVKGIGVEVVVVGYDHMFGRDREAGLHELQTMGEQLGFEVFHEEPLCVEGVIVGSSKIREELLRGNIAKATSWLGRPYFLGGKVVQGAGRGSTLGFPTANISSDDARKLVPAEGVYFVEAELGDRKIPGMMNIGVRPTFGDEHQRTIEVHLLDFHEDIYGTSLRISFIKRLRGEIRFASPQDLVAQLKKDREECLKIVEAKEQIS